MSLTSFLLLIGGGILTGTIGTLLGIGGGLFLVPYLVLLLNLPMHQAIATSILAVIATSSAGAVMNLERNLVNLRLGMSLEVATVVGAVLGGISANLLPGEILSLLFSVVLLVIAGMMLYRRYRPIPASALSPDGNLQARYRDEVSGEEVIYSVRNLGATSAISFLAGNLSGLLGIGGGVFKVPAMHLISGVPLKAAAATSNFMIGVTAVASAFIYFSHGHVNPVIASSTTLGALAGATLGIRLSRVLKTELITYLFVGLLILAAVQMLLR